MARYPSLSSTDSSPESHTDEPACPTCRDAGYLRYDVPPDHPNFGKLVACPICGPTRQREYQARVAEQISRECGLGDLQRHMTFETFEAYPGNEAVLEESTRFAREGIDAGAWLVIQGKETGTGKTHLLAAIANAAIARGVPTFYAYTTELLDHLRAGYRRTDGDDGEEAAAGDFQERWNRIKSVRLLLVDDFGVEVHKPWVRERFEALFDARLRDGLPTAVTTNLTGPDWLRLSDRIRDRFDRYEPAAVLEMRAMKYRFWKRQVLAPQASAGVPF